MEAMSDKFLLRGEENGRDCTILARRMCLMARKAFSSQVQLFIPILQSKKLSIQPNSAFQVAQFRGFAVGMPW